MCVLRTCCFSDLAVLSVSGATKHVYAVMKYSVLIEVSRLVTLDIGSHEIKYTFLLLLSRPALNSQGNKCQTGVASVFKTFVVLPQSRRESCSQPICEPMYGLHVNGSLSELDLANVIFRTWQRDTA